jgi:ribosomal protein L39E
MNHHRGRLAIATRTNRKVPMKIVKTVKTSLAVAVSLGRPPGEALKRREAKNKSLGAGRKS